MLLFFLKEIKMLLELQKLHMQNAWVHPHAQVQSFYLKAAVLLNKYKGLFYVFGVYIKRYLISANFCAVIEYLKCQSRS